MTPLDRAVTICGTQSELARRVTGKPATGYVYHWRKNGVTAIVAAAIENAVKAAIAERQESAEAAEKHGGPVLADELVPGVQWIRGADGLVTGFVNPVPQSQEIAGGCHVR